MRALQLGQARCRARLAGLCCPGSWRGQHEYTRRACELPRCLARGLALRIDAQPRSHLEGLTHPLGRPALTWLTAFMVDTRPSGLSWSIDRPRQVNLDVYSVARRHRRLVCCASRNFPRWSATCNDFEGDFMATAVAVRVQKRRSARRPAELRRLRLWVPDTKRQRFAAACTRQATLAAQADAATSGLLGFMDQALCDLDGLRE